MKHAVSRSQNGSALGALLALCIALAEAYLRKRGRKRTARIVWGGLALALASAACAQVEVRDDRGTPQLFAAPPQRVVSLLPSLTESVCTLGACARLVGVDRFSNWPPQVTRLPKLGGLDDAQIERIVALKPDVVLASRSARVVARLEALGQRVIVIQAETHADVKRMLQTLGELLGAPVQAQEAWSRIEADLRRAAEQVPSAVRGQRVYFEVAAAPYAASAGSFIGQTLSQLGMANVVPAELGGYPRLNPEFVVRSQPDIVIAARRDMQGMRLRPGWQKLHALQSERVCAFDVAPYDMLVRPGPRLGEGALVLAECLARLGAAAPPSREGAPK
ncbi:MAG: helical backbone metal receptor [Burkholderiaceae bacterium]